MKYDYINCTEYTPTKLSSHELKPSQNIYNNTDTQTHNSWYNYLADIWEFDNFNQETSNCSLNGTWYNDLGSSMVVTQNQDGLLEGHYYTAVERQNGSSGGGNAAIHGAISSQSVFSFGIVWNRGTSISVFIGQCIPSVLNAAILKAQWALVVSQDSIDTSWRAFYTGMNNFYKETKRKFARDWSSEEGLGIYFNGPDYALTAKVVLPGGQQYKVRGALTKNNTIYLYGAMNITAIGITGLFFKTRKSEILKITLLKYDYVICNKYTPTEISSHELKPSQNISNKIDRQTHNSRYNYLANLGDFEIYNGPPNCSLNGSWYNDLGSTMNVTQNQDGLLEGEYHTAVEYSNGTSGGGKAALHGAISPYSVFSFGVVWDEGTSISIFIGQCIPSGNILKTEWSLVACRDSIETSWDAFYTGMNYFYKKVIEE